MRPLNEMSRDQTERAPEPQRWQALVKQLQSNVRTEPCNRRTHPFAHLLTLKILIWHSNAGDWQLRHAALTDQTWFTMRVCERERVSVCERERQRARAPVRWKWAEFGVRIVNLTVTYHVIHLSDALCTLTHSFARSLSRTQTHTHTQMCIHTHSCRHTQISTHDAPPALPAIHSNLGDNQSARSVLFCFASFARFRFLGLHRCQRSCSSREDSSSI